MGEAPIARRWQRQRRKAERGRPRRQSFGSNPNQVREAHSSSSTIVSKSGPAAHRRPHSAAPRPRPSTPCLSIIIVLILVVHHQHRLLQQRPRIRCRHREQGKASLASRKTPEQFALHDSHARKPRSLEEEEEGRQERASPSAALWLQHRSEPSLIRSPRLHQQIKISDPRASTEPANFDRRRQKLGRACAALEYET